MLRVFKFIGKLMAKRPVKVLLITSLIFMILIAGVSKIKMATGNDTLVKSNTEAYLSNLEMEKDFGGDSIIVLFTGENTEDILSKETITKMWNVQQEMKNEENLFSFMSPASIVNQVTDMQKNEITGRISDISNGLKEMSTKLVGIGNQLQTKEVKDPKELQTMMNDLSKSVVAFDKLIDAQKNMGKGTDQIKSGMTQIAGGLEQVSTQLNQLSQGMENTNQQLSMQLQQISSKLNETSNGLTDMSNKTGQLNKGHDQTALALEQMKNKISNQTDTSLGSLSGALNPKQLQEMASGFITMGGKLGEISDGLQVIHDKSGMMKAEMPANQSDLNQIFYDENGKLRPNFSDVIVDHNHALMVVKMKGNLSDSEKDSIYQSLDSALQKQNFKNVDYFVSGKPVLDSALRSEMTASMRNMVILAVGLMFLILLIIFKVRWRILSLPIIFFAVIATIGLMGFADIPMTMVSMAVFPILIGLGVDYAIQFQNRYEEERSLKKTLTQMGPAVGTAIFATILGFIALYMSPVPMIIDFGKMLTIGVVISYIAGIFILMAILYIRDHYFGNSKNEVKVSNKKESFLEKGLKGLTSYVIKFSPIVLILAILLTGWGIWADEKVGVQTDIETFMPQDTPELAQIHQLRDVLGSTDQIVIYMNDNNVLSKNNLEWIDKKTEELKSNYPNSVVSTKSITSLVRKMNNGNEMDYQKELEFIHNLPENQRKMFVNSENDKAVILVNIKHMPIEDIKGFISNVNRDVKDANMNVIITGKSVLDVEMINGLTSGRVGMTFSGMGLVLLGLLLVYRNPIRAFIPVFPISLIVGLSGGIMYLLGLKYTPLTATLGALIIGIGTEFTILLLERYMEERKNGKDKLEAMQTAVSKIGKAIIASGMTVIGGFSALIVSNFVILQDFGMMTLINMSLALFSTLVVLPPVIYMLDRWIIKQDKVKKTIPVTD